MSTENASMAVGKLCKSMPEMVACGVRDTCARSGASSSSAFCSDFALLDEICVADGMGRMTGCAEYTRCRSLGHVECQVSSLPSIPTTRQAKDNIDQMCCGSSGMDMGGCSNCASCNNKNSGPKGCNALVGYADLCISMPSMNECRQWTTLCHDIKTTKTHELLDLCQESSHHIVPGVMLMYFHQGIHETLLFKSLTPRTTTQYVLCCVTSVIIGIIAHALGVARPLLEIKIEQKLATNEDDKASSAEKKSLLNKESNEPRTCQRFHFWHDLSRAVLASVHIGVAYVAMLVAMTYNVGYFFSISLGYGVSSFLFTRFVAKVPRHRIGYTQESAHDALSNVSVLDIPSCCQ